MKCKCCNSENIKVQFEVRILKKYPAKYLRCEKCGFVFAENPHWIEESYQSAITFADTGISQRNIYFAKFLKIFIRLNFEKKGVFVDYAGGYGLLTRLMRDLGFEYLWTDKYCENLFARGFEYQNGSKIDFITAFEVFEHLSDPSIEVDKMLEISDTIIFSTELIPNPVPAPDQWWYYAFNHGQHLAFYTPESLNQLANSKGLKYYHDKNMHVFTKKNLSDLRIKMCRIIPYTPFHLLFDAGLKSLMIADHEKMME